MKHGDHPPSAMLLRPITLVRDFRSIHADARHLLTLILPVLPMTPSR